MLLSDFVELYVSRRDISPRYAQQIRLHAKAFGEARLCELTAERFNAHLRDMRENGLSAGYRRSRRRNLLVLWNAAADDDLCEYPPRRHLMQIQPQQRIPQAWTLAELKILLHTAQQLCDYLPNGIQRGLFWEAFIRVGYDCALRLSDSLSLPAELATGGGAFRVLIGKTGVEKLCRVRPETMQAVRAIVPPDRRLLFDWPFSREQFFYHWRGLTKSLPPGRRFGPNRLRHTSASHLARISPGHVQAHLGHQSETMARRHYVDPTIADTDQPLPPPLE